MKTWKYIFFPDIKEKQNLKLFLLYTHWNTYQQRSKLLQTYNFENREYKNIGYGYFALKNRGSNEKKYLQNTCRSQITEPWMSLHQTLWALIISSSVYNDLQTHPWINLHAIIIHHRTKYSTSGWRKKINLGSKSSYDNSSFNHSVCN